MLLSTFFPRVYNFYSANCVSIHILETLQYAFLSFHMELSINFSDFALLLLTRQAATRPATNKHAEPTNSSNVSHEIKL